MTRILATGNRNYACIYSPQNQALARQKLCPRSTADYFVPKNDRPDPAISFPAACWKKNRRASKTTLLLVAGWPPVVFSVLCYIPHQMQRPAASRRASRTIAPLASMAWDGASKSCASLGYGTREVADDLEAVLDRLSSTGAAFEIRKHASASRIPLPQVNLAEAVKALRVYAGCLFQISGKLARQGSASQTQT